MLTRSFSFSVLGMPLHFNCCSPLFSSWQYIFFPRAKNSVKYLPLKSSEKSPSIVPIRGSTHPGLLLNTTRSVLRQTSRSLTRRSSFRSFNRASPVTKRLIYALHLLLGAIHCYFSEYVTTKGLSFVNQYKILCFMLKVENDPSHVVIAHAVFVLLETGLMTNL